ncbi:multidrug resistance protein 1B, partial [Caerostris extrusa]
MLSADSKSSSVCSTKDYGLLDSEDGQNSIVVNLSKYLSSSKDDLKKEKNAEKSELEQSVPFCALFKYASCWDKVLIAVGFIVALCSGALWPLVMILFGNFIDQFVTYATNNVTDSVRGLPEELLHNTAELSLYNAYLGIILLVFNYIIVCSFSLSAVNQAHKIRCLFMSSILKQDIAWFDTHQTGDFASRLTG